MSAYFDVNWLSNSRNEAWGRQATPATPATAWAKRPSGANRSPSPPNQALGPLFNFLECGFGGPDRTDQDQQKASMGMGDGAHTGDQGRLCVA